MQQPFAFPAVPNAPGLGAAMRRAGAATRTAQTIGLEWLDYAKQSADDLKATMQKLATATTPAETFAIQGAYLRDAGERFASRSAVLGGLYATLAADLTRPAFALGAPRAA